ncbi:pyridoxal phosphate-dependent decarboxylase family protein [Nocardioides antri]|uniref:Aminotransferase class I/II-fold pyridoxal phosphate-dependent enzyme n=1 Tax=Nocardioides antri TaxID=2607659 RepID=A0A5B1M5S6_9ACTN|nr:aminotransferase class I/II-fold pyridoxal phosphate-dependent enzyme [Nocardioides antri]KAA1428203.1 aminotransferase class I/II-fold pyridoxal phosphate-dependent enzyme [Nocardioides antri]
MTDRSLRSLVDTALAALANGREQRGGPLPAATPRQVEQTVDAALGHATLPAEGIGDEAALADLVTAVAAGAADPTDPACTGHLHCPPLDVAVAADLVASALNQSLDSWDQAPAATVLEERVIETLGDLAGLPGAAGVITTGGTASTYTALLLARDAAPSPVRVYSSEIAHFSADRGAHLLGIGEVVKVPVDEQHRLDVPHLARLLADAPADSRPVVVATAGTTDFGSIDPLPALAALVRTHGGWLHVDAAYGGGLLFSDTHRDLLTGVELADTVSLDLHKLGWQPAAAGVLLARDPALFEPLARRAAYLNPVDDEDEGYTSLLGRSLRTTRRADVLKIAVTLRALGRRGLGEKVDACLRLAQYSAAAVRARVDLELVADPVLSTVVFRYAGPDGTADDQINGRLRRALLSSGQAVVGRTEHRGRVLLKLTLLNPDATEADVDRVLDLVVAAGRAELES